MNKKRVGILTGGGDCPGLNGVIRGIVKRGILEYNMQMIGILDGYKGLIENISRELVLDDISGILPRGGTILGTSNRDNPFKYQIEKDGEKIITDVSDRVINNIRNLKLDALIIIGGDGSLKIAYELFKRGIPVIGVPKTIDNDLSLTDVTFGFDTALNTATEAIDKIHTTAESHHRVMIIEVMGRDAGWIALNAGIAGGAHIILIPEIPFTIKNIAQQICERHSHGKKFSIIVIAEGAIEKGGVQVVSKIVKDVTMPIRLGGVGNKVGDELEKILGLETRVTVLGHLQRGGNPSPFDRILATRFGAMAIQMVKEEKFGVMVSLRAPDIVAVPLQDAIGYPKFVNPAGQLVQTARSIGVGFGD